MAGVAEGDLFRDRIEPKWFVEGDEQMVVGSEKVVQGDIYQLSASLEFERAEYHILIAYSTF